MIKKVILCLCMVVLFASCGSQGPKPFSCEIILDGPISDNGKYPASFSNLLAPIDFNEEAFLLPKPIKARRVDTGGGAIELKAFAFEDKGEPTFEFYKEWMPIFFRDSIPSKQLLAPKGNLATAIDWVQKNAGKQVIIVLSSDQIEALADKENILLAQDEAAVCKHIKKIMEATPDAKIVLVIASEPLVPEQTIANDTTRERLQNENTEAGKIDDEGKRNSQLGNVDIELSKYKDDWRVLYERMLNRVYGKEHHEAFDFLREAAQLAIAKGEASYLLDKIEGDKNGTLWKLSHGHDDSWHPIIEALEHNNSSLLKESHVGKHH